MGTEVFIEGGELADSSWHKAENCDPMLLDQLENPVRRRMNVHTFIEHNGTAKEEHPNEFPRRHHPTEIRKPTEAIVMLAIEGVSHLFDYLRQRSTVGVHDGFRLSRGA